MTHIAIDFDATVYSLSAIKKAAYCFGDAYFSSIETTGTGQIRVLLTLKTGSQMPDSLEGDFRNAVLDQDLRESIAAETERVRNVLIAQAFSNVSLTDDVSESADFRADPLHIAKAQAHLD